jgi:hypothetical protein
MTLTLVADPGSGNIDQHPSGLVVMRAEDFIGPARGDLTTAADGSSVVGTVVQETQALVVPSSFNDAGTGASYFRRWPLAADTLRIPKATLSPYLSGETSFDAYVSIKVTGDVPSNARYKKTNSYYNPFAGGAAVGVAWGRDTTRIDGINIVPTEQWGDQYLMSEPLRIFWSGISSGTNLVMRAWGVTGGTIELSFDLIYLMPRGGFPSLRQIYGMGFFPFDISANGVVPVDEDNDDTDNVIGKFSVGSTTGAVTGFQDLTTVDFQEAGDEPTNYDITVGRWDGSSPDNDPLDPQSWITFIAAPHYIPDITLINDTFSGSALGTSGVTFATTEGYIVTGSAINSGGPGHPNATSGWTRDGAGNLRCSIPTDTSIPGGGPYAGTPHANCFFGASETLVGGSLDPRDYQHRLIGLEDFTAETTFSADSASDEVNWLFGFQAITQADQLPAVPSMLEDGYGVHLDLTAGVLSARLTLCQATPVVAPSFYTGNILYDFSSTITVDAAYVALTVYRAKVERRRYRVRAKVWLDGTSEPGAWDFDEYMPFRWYGPGGVPPTGFIDYPYDTNWAGDPDHDNVTLPGGPTLGQRSIPGMVAWPNTVCPNQIIYCSEYILTIEPEGATPVDMLVAEEDYNFANRSNDVVIPYATIPSARWVEGSLRKRHFGGDTNGFNVLGWKDGSGGPEMQASAFSQLYELAKIGGILSLSHLRVANRYAGVTTVRG